MYVNAMENISMENDIITFNTPTHTHEAFHAKHINYKRSLKMQNLHREIHNV